MRFDTMLPILLRALSAMLVAAVCVASPLALADDTTAVAAGTTISPASSGNNTFGVTVQAGEVAKGANDALTKIQSFFSAIIPAAVTVSQSVKSEADKFAGGLGLITMILAFVRFAATRDPIQAWTDLFEELAILGIFASLYIGYQTFAPGFFGWFQKLADLIQTGAGQGVFASMAAASGSAYEAVVTAFKGANPLNFIAITISMIPMLVAYIILLITCLVFAYMNNVGLIQAAVGIVMGQIAFALGFSSFTRGFFKAWLDYMIHAGMYCVISAILSKLVFASLGSAISVAAANGLVTSEGATYCLDLAFFVFLLSFEIPKMAAMFGGGANASGGMFKQAAQTAAKAAAFL
ncbi:hypothetical protein EHZ25_19970 [Paraburkholderia tropica]|nr:hypothetical protein EHZ25_19970 [Paraburkholderia tropica]